MANLDGLEWSVVDFSSNPVPGDPDKAEELANHYKIRSGNFRDMADALDRIKSNSASFQGKWVKKLNQDSGNMPADFRDFSDSCSTVGRRIGAWASDMRSFQNVARLEYERAKEARDTSARLQRRSDEQWNRYSSCGRELGGLPASDDCSFRRAEVERQRDAAKDLLDRYERSLASATAEYDRAREAINHVKDEYGAAAERHAAVIKAIDCTPKSIKGVERFYYSDGWQKLVLVVKVASFAAGVASFFVGGWFVAAVGAAAAAAQLAITGFQVREKDATPIDFAFDVVSLGLAGMSVGKFAKETMALKTVRGRVNRLKRCAFDKSDALKAIQRNMDKALAKTNGVPGKVCRPFRSQEGWMTTMKRVSSDRRTQKMFAKEFVDQFGKKFLNTDVREFKGRWRVIRDKRFNTYHKIEAGLKIVNGAKPTAKYVENGYDSGFNWASTGNMVAQYLFPGYRKACKPIEGIGKVAGNAW